MGEFKRIDRTKIKSLFAIHSFKRDYSNFINDILQKLYQKEQKWSKLLGDGNYGVIDTDYDLTKAPMNDEVRKFFVKVHNNKDPKWSLLNYVNTHYTAFSEIADTLNYWISKDFIKNQQSLDFNKDYFDNLEKMKYLLTRTDKYIFFPQEKLSIFYKIMGAIATTTYYGNKGECITLEHLSKFGDITDVIKSEPGQRIDTHQGVDIRFKLNGVPKTLQCKSFRDFEYVDGLYIFRNISNPGWYNVDYFSFVNREMLYIFDTRKGDLRYKQHLAVYIFDEKLLKNKVKI